MISEIDLICENEDEFIVNLIKYTSLEKISRIFEHEKSHFDMAKKLRYKPVYGIKIYLKNNNEKILETDVYVLNGFRKEEDVIKIALAPKNPSEVDYALAREYGWRGK